MDASELVAAVEELVVLREKIAKAGFDVVLGVGGVSVWDLPRSVFDQLEAVEIPHNLNDKYSKPTWWKKVGGKHYVTREPPVS